MGWSTIPSCFVVTCNGSSASPMRASHRRYVEANGPFPHACALCGEPVDGHTKPFDASAAVLHVGDDGEAEIFHMACHTTFHGTGRVHTSQAKAKNRAAQEGEGNSFFGRHHTPEHNAYISALEKGRPSAFKGKTHTPETRAKIAEGVKRWLRGKRSDNG
jgi:hypothetical protein